MQDVLEPKKSSTGGTDMIFTGKLQANKSIVSPEMLAKKASSRSTYKKLKTDKEDDEELLGLLQDSAFNTVNADEIIEARA